MIPKDIKNIISKGTFCPLCHKGMLGIRIDNGYMPIAEIVCNNCYKKFIIKYTEKPFKVLEIVEDKEN